MKLKYIIFDSPNAGVFPVLFPVSVDHCFLRDSVYSRFPGVKVISAGFCSFVSDSVLCWGESVSLKVKARPEDVNEIEFMFGK